MGVVDSTLEGKSEARELLQGEDWLDGSLHEEEDPDGFHPQTWVIAM